MAISTLALTGCARDMKSSTYVSSDTVGTVVEGVVVSARPVTIKDTDKLQDNALGGIAGGVAGGAVGNTIGGGSGKTVATVGGAIAGAVIGSMIQQELGSSEGMEYVVKVSKENMASAPANTETNNVTINQNKVGDKLKNSIQTNMKSELISVVQGNDTVFSVGQKVFVIYNDGRARLTPAM